MARKPLTRGQLVKKLDKVFKKYVRYKHSFRSYDDWYATCVTCSRTIPTKKIHGGHYIRCGIMTVRWDEMNVHPQCALCNTYNFGEPTLYRIYIVSIYGEESARRLDKALLDWKAGKAKTIPIQWLRDSIEYYENKLKALNI